MTTRTYKVFAVDERSAFVRAVSKDRITRHRGDYRGRTARIVKKNAKGALHLWKVTLT